MMRRWSTYGCMLGLMMALPTASYADDLCGGDEARRQFEAKARGDLAKAEQSGKPGVLYSAYRNLSNDDCASTELIAKARQQMPKLGREAAKQAEASGVLVSKDPKSPSAFFWWEAVREFPEADRVMLKAVQARPQDLDLFKAAWDIDRLSGQRGGGDITYEAPAAYRQALVKVATAAVNRLMAQEEKEAQGLTADIGTAGMASSRSLRTLEQAAEWMSFLPGGDKPAKLRAEQRGDAILKRGDAGFSAGLAVPYYEFAGSPKALQARKQIEERQRAIEKRAEKTKEAIEQAVQEKSQSEQSKFKKGQADLEKELGF